MPPIVSVLIPCYQDGAFLKQTIESVLAQCWEQMEIIISDEGTDPRCVNVVRRFNDPRIRYFSNPVRLGMTRNWNAALGHAIGDLVIKLDGDDVMLPGTITRLVQALDKQPDANFAACLALECDAQLENSKLYGKRGYQLAAINPKQDQLLTPSEIFPWLFADCQLWHSCSLMFRHGNLTEIGGWDQRWSCASDTDIILRAFLEGYSLAHCGFDGVLYRKRRNSVSFHFRQDARLLWESTLIHLRALEQWRRQGRPIIRPLRIAWFRYWLRLVDLKHEHADLAYHYYIDLSETIEPPPFKLRVTETARRQLHKLKQRLLASAGR